MDPALRRNRMAMYNMIADFLMAETREEQSRILCAIVHLMLRRPRFRSEDSGAIIRCNRFRTYVTDSLAALLIVNVRSDPTGWSDPFGCPISNMINGGNDEQFRLMFRVSRNVFRLLMGDLSPYLKDGKSIDASKNIPASTKLGITLYFMAHGGSGLNLGYVSGLSRSTALKYLHQVAELIYRIITPKFMGRRLLEAPNYMEANRAGFQARNGFPMVGACIDGTHIPYNPNSGQREEDFKNYKGWTSILAIGIVSSSHCFVDLDVGWPGRLHDKTCSENSSFWRSMNLDRDLWLGADGVALADTAWGKGTKLIMCPYKASDGGTMKQQWFNFVHSSTRFFIEETFGRWKNRFRFLLKSIEFSQERTNTLIFASAVLHNVCTLCNDLDDSYFDQSESTISLFENHFHWMRSCAHCARNGPMAL